MATFDDVARLAAQLPAVTQAVRGGHRPGLAWSVEGKVFAWERAFSKADVTRYGSDPVPGGPILALVVEDLAEKAAVLDAGRPGFFTIPHFAGYAAVLVQLDAADDGDLRDALTDAWLAVAPDGLAKAYVAGR
ncbi:hypothetical protein ET495_01710 [Xylanimonas allomyrinae]|uniref:MmcQ/YjbR family DNA-binding protein n=1 Tax=Xylanimonas allomyrinae TaxID=2509459 RepID=A0A4V0YDX2_9MICO|nr:hypothetical protein [Xylanimonas allomyrinae]QAY62201.1 hypothetical protein ET495_01710 [Xylanimonas allomyrinae]